MIKEIHFNSKVIGFHDSEPKLINTYQWCSGERKEAGVLPSWSPPSVLSLMKCQNISCACPSIHLQYLFKIFSGTYHLLSTKGTAVNKTGGPCPPCPLRVYSLAKKMPMKVLVAQLCLPLCNPTDCSPPGSSLWNSPGKNTGVGCHFLLQGVFPTQRLNLHLLRCRLILYHLSHHGSPDYTLKL